MLLSAGFFRSVERFSDRTALEVGGGSATYGELSDAARSLAATLRKHAPASPARTAIYGHRSTAAFSGLLGALLRGHAYVPLGPTFPPARSRAMLERSRCGAVVVDGGSEPRLPEVLKGLPASLVLVFPDHADASALSDPYTGHTVICKDAFCRADAWVEESVAEDDPAYVLFTSGSTGIPKGVLVSHRNAVSFVSYVIERYGFTEEDRFSQTFSLTFDLSVFDLFVAWSCGGCVCCPPEKALLKPGRYIRESGLSVWFSVPTTASVMKKLGELKAGAYPGLRLSLFCGEALPVEVTRQWAEAAPSSIVENLYGPTELTIACAVYRWDGDPSEAESENGVVPIGTAFPSMTAVVVDEELEEVAPGEEGELLMTGPQLSLGYLDDPIKTGEAFVVPPGRTERYYRTGDRVRSPKDGAPMTYLGRVDLQIKIRGYRVELSEIEHVLRTVANVDTVVAVGWPLTPGGASGIAAFVDPCDADVPTLRARAKEHLPDYMVPRDIRFVERFPRNGSGKIDRKALIAMLETSK